ncbi:MAG: helicase HerA-like domain-containing protein [Fimbriimonadales bacterium]
MDESKGIYIGLGETELYLLPKMANRHGLIAGATGTGKTVSMQILAEGFSAIGVPTFMADVKGDVAGISQPGEPKPKLVERAQQIRFEPYEFKACPTIFWDPFAQAGHATRATVSDMGPLLLSRLMSLNDTQEGVLNMAFKIADEQELLLLDLKDLRQMLVFLAENSKDFTVQYGNVSDASVGAIQRALLVLEQQGAEGFFGETALDINDLMKVDENGKGYVNVISAEKLMQSPRFYATFLLWLLTELFEELPEMGDLDKPKLVFFFDEAHLLFDDAPAALVEKIEQVVRLVRSKGVGVFFITQNPLDVPDKILGQLGSRIQHALRAYTPREQKAVRAAAETFRPNPNVNVEEAIIQLEVGEALVSVLEEKGVPSIVQKTLIRPPSSRLGPITAQERGGIIDASPVREKYEETVDRESAYEMLAERLAAASTKTAPGAVNEEPVANRERTGRGASLPTAVGNSIMRVIISVAGQAGRSIVRGVLGNIFKGGRSRRLQPSGRSKKAKTAKVDIPLLGLKEINEPSTKGRGRDDDAPAVDLDSND